LDLTKNSAGFRKCSAMQLKAEVRAEYNAELSLIDAVYIPVCYIVAFILSSFISVKYADFMDLCTKLITEDSMRYV
jgi:hypothetical protein